MARASLSNLSTFLTKLKSIFSLIGHTHSQYVQNTTYNNKMSSLDSSVSTLSSGKVAKAGDTMSGNLVITRTTQAECDVNNTQANVGVGIVAGSSGARGLYDTVNNKWIVYSPSGKTTTNLPSNPASTDNSTQIATTNYVKTNLSSYVAKSGDTLTGSSFIKNNDTGYLIIAGGTGTSNGASLQLYGKDNNNGIAYLIGNNGNGQQIISINGNGVTSCPTPTTTDNSTKIATTSFVKSQGCNIDSSGAKYIRYTNGLQICWGCSATGEVTYPVAFKNADMNITLSQFASSGNLFTNTITAMNSTTFTIKTFNSSGTSVTVSSSINWIAIGWWK